jgi:hypothetical protein
MPAAWAQPSRDERVPLHTAPLEEVFWMPAIATIPEVFRSRLPAADRASNAFERGVAFDILRKAFGTPCRIHALLKEPKDKCRKPNLLGVSSSRDHFQFSISTIK